MKLLDMGRTEACLAVACLSLQDKDLQHVLFINNNANFLIMLFVSKGAIREKFGERQINKNMVSNKAIFDTGSYGGERATCN